MQAAGRIARSVVPGSTAWLLGSPEAETEHMCQCVAHCELTEHACCPGDSVPDTLVKAQEKQPVICMSTLPHNRVPHPHPDHTPCHVGARVKARTECHPPRATLQPNGLE